MAQTKTVADLATSHLPRTTRVHLLYADERETLRQVLDRQVLRDERRETLSARIEAEPEGDRQDRLFNDLDDVDASEAEDFRLLLPLLRSLNV